MRALVKLRALFQLAGWDESDHPRDANGRFAGGGGGPTGRDEDARQGELPGSPGSAHKDMADRLGKLGKLSPKDADAVALSAAALGLGADDTVPQLMLAHAVAEVAKGNLDPKAAVAQLTERVRASGVQQTQDYVPTPEVLEAMGTAWEERIPDNLQPHERRVLFNALASASGIASIRGTAMARALVGRLHLDGLKRIGEDGFANLQEARGAFAAAIFNEHLDALETKIDEAKGFGPGIMAGAGRWASDVEDTDLGQVFDDDGNVEDETERAALVSLMSDNQQKLVDKGLTPMEALDENAPPASGKVALRSYYEQLAESTADPAVMVDKPPHLSQTLWQPEYRAAYIEQLAVEVERGGEQVDVFSAARAAEDRLMESASALEQYKGNDYFTINHFLRTDGEKIIAHDGSSTRFTRGEVVDAVQGMDDALDNFGMRYPEDHDSFADTIEALGGKPMTQPGVVYRGLSFSTRTGLTPDTIEERFGKGRVMQREFTSVSWTDAVASGAFTGKGDVPGGVVMELRMDKGLRMVQGNLSETELILERGTEIEVEELIKPERPGGMYRIRGKLRAPSSYSREARAKELHTLRNLNYTDEEERS